MRGGTSLPLGGRGVDLQFPVPGPQALSWAGICSSGGPFLVRFATRVPSLLPHRFEIPGLSEPPFLRRPSPAQGLETSIHTEGALQVFRFPAPPRAQSRGRIPCVQWFVRGCCLPVPVCTLGRGATRPLGPRLVACSDNGGEGWRGWRPPERGNKE